MFINILEYLAEDGATRDRPIIFSVVKSAPCLLVMETRSMQFDSQCIAVSMVPQNPLRLSSIFIDTQ